MNRIYLLIIFVLFYNTSSAQVTLNGFTSSENARAHDSIGEGIGSKNLILLSASDIGFGVSKDSTSINKKTCVVAFIGCDETRVIISDFINYFYSEYIKTNSYETAFFNAKKYLSDKYPNSPVTPVLNCEK